MMLRLVLVGGVALLGLTIPSKPGCDRWLNSAQSWASAVLADWDNWTPRGRGGSDSSAGPVARVCEQCRLARERRAAQTRMPAAAAPVMSLASAIVGATGGGGNGCDVLPADVFAPAVVVFEPIKVAEPLLVSVTHELNVVSESQTETPVPARPACGQTAFPDFVASVRVVTDKLEKAMMGGLKRGLEVALVRLNSMRADGAEPSALPSVMIADDHFLCGALGDEYDDNCADIPPASPAAVAQEAAPVAVADFDLELGCALESDATTVVAPIAAPTRLAAELPWPAFAPAGSPEQPEMAVTDAGQSHPAPPGNTAVAASTFDASRQPVTTIDARPHTTLGSAAASSGLEQAVELTRNAAFAWVRVLTGPALVNVTRAVKRRPSAAAQRSTVAGRDAVERSSLSSSSHDSAGSITSRRYPSLAATRSTSPWLGNARPVCSLKRCMAFMNSISSSVYCLSNVVGSIRLRRSFF